MSFRTNDLFSFCKRQSESLNHLFFHCPYSKQFWNDLKSTGAVFQAKGSASPCKMCLSESSLKMLNYFTMMEKFSCGIEEIILPNINGFRAKTAAKYETEKIISRKMDTVWWPINAIEKSASEW